MKNYPNKKIVYIYIVHCENLITDQNKILYTGKKICMLNNYQNKEVMHLRYIVHFEKNSKN